MRLTERFLATDPPTRAEFEAAAAEVRSLLPPLTVNAAIGVAGAITTAAAVGLGRRTYDPAKIHGYRLSRDTVDRVLGDLAALPLERRACTPGLEPERAPVIVGGLVALQEIMARYALDEIEVSERDILHGTALAAAALG